VNEAVADSRGRKFEGAAVLIPFPRLHYPRVGRVGASHYQPADNRLSEFHGDDEVGRGVLPL
jgi:hypothetical protein